MTKPSLSQNLNAMTESSSSSSSIPRILQTLVHIGNFLRSRYFTFKSSYFGSKINGNFVKNVVKKPVSTVYDAFSGYREAVGLQIEAFWRRNYLVLLGAGGIVFWRVLFGIVGSSQGIWFLSLSTAIVIFAVMGVPHFGTHLRAHVMSGGGVMLKNFKSRFRSKGCFLIFPIRGYEREGLVSIEVKNKKAQYDTKLLLVEIPLAMGPDQRATLDWRQRRLQNFWWKISEPRDPVVKAMAATKEFEDLDEMKDGEDAEREHQDAERRHNILFV